MYAHGRGAMIDRVHNLSRALSLHTSTPCCLCSYCLLVDAWIVRLTCGIVIIRIVSKRDILIRVVIDVLLTGD